MARVVTAVLLSPWLLASPLPKRKVAPRLAEARVPAGAPGCKVDADGVAMGQTKAAGQLTLRGAPVGDHHFHVDCPGQNEVTVFLSLHPGERAKIDVNAIRAKSLRFATPLQAAEARLRLRRIVERGIRSRSRGQFDEAVKLLREAIQLDPNNPDLHRELGVTFLINHDRLAHCCGLSKNSNLDELLKNLVGDQERARRQPEA